MKTALQLTDEEAARISAGATPVQVPAWTSLAHVQLILELERAFDVMFDAGEIASMASVPAIMAALERARS
jgi:acyl carrier protein